MIDESCCFPSVLVRSRIRNILHTKNLTYIPKFAIFKGMLPFPDLFILGIQPFVFGGVNLQTNPYRFP